LKKKKKKKKYINIIFNSILFNVNKYNLKIYMHSLNQIEENREIQDQLSILKQKYMNSSANVNDLTNQLSQISEDLDNVKVNRKYIFR